MANYTKLAVFSLNSWRTLRSAGAQQLRFGHQLAAGRQMSTTAAAAESPAPTDSATGSVGVVVKAERVSKAMRAYIQRATEHDEFMQVQQDEYRIGKRHLANMMGEDPETFTQDDVDRAIEYLFPSGLYDKRARPTMKAPEQVFPQRKAAEFDASGRPYHSFFYTGKANFFRLLFDIVEHINTANEFEDRQIAKHVKPDPALNIDLSGTQWLSKDELQLQLVEDIADIEYDNFVKSISRLVDLPYSYKSKDFIMQYRKPLMAVANTYDTMRPQYGEDGRMFVTTYECLRKRARATVTVRSPGTGLIDINGQDITYFDDIQPKEQILFPLLFAGQLGKVDVEATVEGGGFSGQAGAIRWGIAMSLRSFVEPEITDRMRLAGLLQRDYRQRERKKPGQEGARRKFTWKKR